MKNNIQIGNCTLVPKITVKNKSGKVIWDVYEAVIKTDKDYTQSVLVATEHETINENITKETLIKFVSYERIERLIKESGNDQIVFLGKIYKKDGKERISRHYIADYCTGGNTAEEEFKRFADSIVEGVKKYEEAIEMSKERQQKNKILNRIKKFGITEKEYDALMLYRGDNYYIPCTLLHEIPLYKLMDRMPIGDPLGKLKYLKDPRNACNFYCNVYSAMCKYRIINSKKITAHRACSLLYKDEMEKSGITSSLLSFLAESKSDAEKDITNYEGQRIDMIYYEANIDGRVPVFDYNLIFDENYNPNNKRYEEILVPPFMGISYKTFKDYTYQVDITYAETMFDANDEILMRQLEKEVFREGVSDIIQRYYEETYEFIIKRRSKLNSDLEREFMDWQKKFKKYLRLRFKKIYQEINKQKTPQLPRRTLISALKSVRDRLTSPSLPPKGHGTK